MRGGGVKCRFGKCVKICHKQLKIDYYRHRMIHVNLTVTINQKLTEKYFKKNNKGI